ncbi:hypothetical protein BGX38DRAFT_587744 [Terfezia claveryi]|nr:hypothetical protein BGX38DRAFT_587744 [Terfezia claveryi]
MPPMSTLLLRVHTMGLVNAYSYNIHKPRSYNIYIQVNKVIECSERGVCCRIIDLRGDLQSYTNVNLPLAKEHKRGLHLQIPFPRAAYHPNPQLNSLQTSPFSVLTLDGDEYSSIALLVGTSLGRVGTFKILPGESGEGYEVEFCGVTSASLNEPVSCWRRGGKNNHPTEKKKEKPKSDGLSNYFQISKPPVLLIY